MADGFTVRALSIEGERVRLRKARDSDADGFIETQVDERVRRFLGGPRLERDVRAAFGAAGAAALLSGAGCYVVALKDSDDMLGTMVLNRHALEVPGLLEKGGDELELAYVFRRHAWGQGYAFESARMLLKCAASELPDQPVVVVTQTANHASLRLADRLGFNVVGTFEQWGSEQTLATARLHAFKDG
ncbi:GNAT family N-acetyltransferase [Mycobacterium sp. BMJ-28]